MKESRDINGLRFHEVYNVQSEQRQNEVKLLSVMLILYAENETRL